MGALGLAQRDVDATLTAAWGGNYVNDFIDRGRVKRVYVQGDAQFRSRPEDLGDWYVRTAERRDGAVLGVRDHVVEAGAGRRVSRFNGLHVLRDPGRRRAPGAAPARRWTAWRSWRARFRARRSPGAGCPTRSGCRAGRRRICTRISLLVVFLCLAALYESWSIPVSVLLVVPLGLLGAALAVWLRGLENDVYFQVGLLTTMGLAAKNAILIVEFAEQAEKHGRRARATRRLTAARAAPAADPDDLAGLHLRRAAAGHLHRRRRAEPHRHRHRGDRRHDHRHGARDLLRAAVLRRGAEAGAPEVGAR